MAAHRTSPGEGEVRIPSPPTALPEQPVEGLRLLGETLLARADDVLSETIARTASSGEVVDAMVQSSFERI